MAEPQTWRELLSILIENAQERQHIASLSGINAITLQRWANNEGNPRTRNLYQLIAALPDYSTQLTRLIQREYPTFLETSAGNEGELLKIPSRFYTSVMRAYTKTAPSLRFWSIGKLILQQALQHLDPFRLGMMLVITGCTTPNTPTQKVRSLRVLLGQGTAPWQGSWDRYPIFIGIESLGGYVASNQRMIIVQDTQAANHYYHPMVSTEHGRSIVASPIQRSEGVAGCFYVSSTQPFYFTPQRLDLLQSYTQLLSVAFTPSEFYPAQRIDLALFPPQNQQEHYFSTFQQRLLDTMRTAMQNGQSLNSNQATQLVTSQLEEELLQLAKDQVQV